MASIYHEKTVRVPADKAWAALRDVAHPHRLFAGVLTDARIDGDVRTVTFANGMVAQERIIDVDDKRRRVAYTVLGDMFEHHSAAMEIVPDGPDRSRFIWTTDLLPDKHVQMVRPLVEQGAEALARNLEAWPATAKA
jgi:carbon monoxide dehydrogenase subunit G